MKENIDQKPDHGSAVIGKECKPTRQRGSVLFLQVMTVLIVLIVAVLFKSFGGELFESSRLKFSNMVSDEGGYEDIVYPAGEFGNGNA